MYFREPSDNTGELAMKVMWDRTGTLACNGTFNTTQTAYSVPGDWRWRHYVKKWKTAQHGLLWQTSLEGSFQPTVWLGV